MTIVRTRWLSFPVAACTVALTVASCSSGGVDVYERCTSSDSCPSNTVCESPLIDNTSSSTALPANPPTFCTYSCQTDADCPATVGGTKALCILLDGSPVETSFCFSPCTTSCPAGEACISNSGSAGDAGTPVNICVPIYSAPDPLGGTTWTTTTVDPTQVACNVTSSTFTLTFGAGSADDGTPIGGAFSAVLVETFAAPGADAGGVGTGAACDFLLNGVDDLSELAGCTETDRYTGETFTEVLASSTSGTLTLGEGDAPPTVLTTRTGCANPASNVDAGPNVGPESLSNGVLGQSSFTVSGNTLTATLGPVEGSRYTYTKVSP